MLYVWIGSEANVMEKAKAMELTKRISFEEFGGRAKIVEVLRPKDDTSDIQRAQATKGVPTAICCMTRTSFQAFGKN